MQLNLRALPLLLLLVCSCSDEVLNEIDTNPNVPTDVSIDLLLPQVTMNAVAGLAAGGAILPITYFTEYTANTQPNPILPNTNVGGMWFSVYSGLNNLRIMNEKAEEQGAYNFAGIGRILTAYHLATATDIWGDVPYTEALMGSANRQPAFDTQEFIYGELPRILDEAVAYIDRGSADDPSRVDLLYGGNMSHWRKTARALQARYANRLSNVDPEGSARAALAAVAESYESPEESAIFDAYSDIATGGNPWQFQNLRGGNFGLSSTLYNVMLSYGDDPRAPLLFTEVAGAGIVAAPIGENVVDQTYQTYSGPRLAFGDPQPIVTYDEVQLIAAEAHLRLGDRPAAYAAYLTGVTAALQRVGVAEPDIEAYLSQSSIAASPEALTLAEIINQKYIAFWLLQPLEAWNDQRRTGIPELRNPDPDGNPVRLLYPESELAANPNTLDQGINQITVFTDKLYWAR